MQNKTGIAIAVRDNVGDVTNKKLDLLGKKIGDKYKEIHNLSNNSVSVFTPDKKKYITLNNGIISIYYDDVEIVDINIANEMSSDLEAFFDSFLLDYKLKELSVRFIIVSDVGFDTMSASKNNDRLINSVENKNVAGVGYRYLLKNDVSGYDEIKVEPLLDNPNCLFSEGIYNCGDSDMEPLSQLIISKFDYFKTFTETIKNEICNTLKE